MFVLRQVVEDGARDTLSVDAVVLVKMLIFRGQKALMTCLGMEWTGTKMRRSLANSAMSLPSLGMHAGDDGGLIVFQPLVIGEVPGDLPQEIRHPRPPPREIGKRLP